MAHPEWIGIKGIGLNLNQFAIALLTIHAPVADTDIVQYGDIAFLPFHEIGIPIQLLKKCLFFIV